MASLDVDSLFTNIPLEETISICIDQLFCTGNNIEIPKKDFKDLLNIATKESLFLFNNEYYKQIDGVSMGSPLGPTLANIFMCNFERKWLDKCPAAFKPIYYRRYVDDIFVLFSSSDHVEKFKEYFSSNHRNINFSYEKENENNMSFLDILISRKNKKFVTNVIANPLLVEFILILKVLFHKLTKLV